MALFHRISPDCATLYRVCFSLSFSLILSMCLRLILCVCVGLDIHGLGGHG